MKQIIFVLILLPILGFTQNRNIGNFDIRENLSKNGKLAIIALDSLGNTDENISGNYVFTINGFTSALPFREGIAVPDQKITSSTFVFFNHKNQIGSKGRLFYIYKTDGGLTPIAISGLLFLIIPAVVLAIAYMFKKVIVTAIVLIIAFMVFNHSQGLDLTKILESIFASVKNFIA